MFARSSVEFGAGPTKVATCMRKPLATAGLAVVGAAFEVMVKVHPRG